MASQWGAERWREARRVFEGCLACSEDDLPRYLAEQCGRDDELRRAVEKLLEDDARAELESFLERSPELISPAEDWLIGKRLGCYRIASRLGEGGMSTVYRAKRVDREYRQDVAVKLLRMPLQSEPMKRRLRRERQVLAALNHKYIARLLDGGTTGFGAPYIVMEYVRGASITDYCEARGLNTRARIRLFLKVCEAVQHAHANLVVHRDIKPGNILINEHGEPKLLDFGIAKLLDSARFDEEPDQTAPSRQLLTPRYASPEQIRGETITTASDVYALGVLLCRLLTGEMPESVALSDAVARKPPALNPGRRRNESRLRGDLSVIISCALRTEPQRRYQTVEQLSADLGRYLAGQPVSARPSTLSYRTARFVRRHPSGVGMAGAALLAVIAFSVFTQFQASEIARQRDRAEAQQRNAQAEQQRAEAVSGFLVSAFELADPTKSRGEQVTALELLRAGDRRVAARLESEPLMQALLWETMGKAYSSLGVYSDARAAFQNALRVRVREYGADHPEVATCWESLAQISLRTAEFELAREQINRALEIVEADGGYDPVGIAAMIHLRGRIKAATGQRSEADDDYERAFSIRKRHLRSDHPRVLDSQLAIAANRAAIGDYAAGESLVRRVLAIQRDSASTGLHEIAATVTQLVALLRRQGRFAEADPLAREALGFSRAIYGPRHAKVASSLNSLSNIQQKLGQFEQALVTLSQSIDIIAATLGEHHPNYALTQYNMAVLLHQSLQRPQQAEQHYLQANEVARTSLGPDHPNTGILGMGYGQFLIDRGRPDEAEVWLRQSLDLFQRRNAPRGRNIAESRTCLAQALIMMGRYEPAKELLLQALPVHIEEQGNDHELTARTRELLAVASRATGHFPDSEALMIGSEL